MLIRTMSQANPLWGAPRIHGELRKRGIALRQSTIAKYMVRRRRPPSQTWRTFLANHVGQVMAADFFVVPTATYRLPFVLVILAHERRRVVHVAVTDHPTSAWTARQLRNPFPNEECPAYLLHDRDGAFAGVAGTLAAVQIQEVVTAPRSPWQNAYVERFIGSIRRECLDHVIVVNAAGLQRVEKDYVALHALADASKPRQGLAHSAANHAAGGRAHRRGPRGQRAASSLRPRRRLAPRSPSWSPSRRSTAAKAQSLARLCRCQHSRCPATGVAWRNPDSVAAASTSLLVQDVISSFRYPQRRRLSIPFIPPLPCVDACSRSPSCPPGIAD